jgi:hypothetical protein
MAHPMEHAKSAQRRWGGKWEDYIAIEEWYDATKAWLGDSRHRLFRHHSEGIFESEKVFGTHITNSDGKRVMVRYIGEQHVKEDCNGYIPSAKEWITNLDNPPLWMLKTQKIND